MTLSIYDFDGTITHRDSFIEFLKFCSGRKKYFKNIFMLSPFIILYFAKILPNEVLKERFISIFFKGFSIEAFNALCNNFALSILPNILREDAKKSIEEALKRDDRIIIITASPEKYIVPWANEMGIEVIGTKLKVKNRKLTGRLDGKNCYGKEKLERLNKYIKLNDYDEILVYGDSRGDKEMLSVATKKFYRYFKK